MRRRRRLLPALTDFVFQVDQTSHMFITGPDVIKAVTGEEVTMEDLGGAVAHASKSGVTHFVYPSGIDALEAVRYLMSYPPRNNMEPPPTSPPRDRPDRIDDSLISMIPDSANQPYDMVRAVETILDGGEFLEVHEMWAKNIVVGFGRLDGNTVGVVANQPAILAGTLDIEASEKAARFVLRTPSTSRSSPSSTSPAFSPVSSRTSRDNPSRRQALVRLLRGDSAPNHGHHPEGIRRRVRS